MNRKRWIGVAAGLFILLNTCLIIFDKNGEVDRLSYVEKWDEIIKADLTEHLKKDGVLNYAGEHTLYFDERSAQFGEFLIEEGSQVEQGDALYTYEVRNFAETRRSLDQKAQQLRGEISSVETALTTIRSAPINSETLSIMFPDETGAMEVPQGSAEAEMLKVQFIAEQEKELGQLQAKLEAIEAEVSAVNAQEAEVTVMSPYAGRVIKRSESLGNPLLTIVSDKLQTEGILTEEERTKIKRDMAVEVHIPSQQLVMEGTFSEIAEDPDAVTLDTESEYSFSVEFEQEEEDVKLLPGYHAQLYITLDEALNTVTANADWLQGNSIWMMTSAGKLNPETIERGLEVNERVEINGDVEAGDMTAVDNTDRFHPESVFITPLKPNHITWSNVTKMGDWKENVLTGLLSR